MIYLLNDVNYLNKSDFSSVARMILKYGLKSENKNVNVDSAVRIDKNGKPYMDNVFFNISHCKNAIAVDIAKSNTGIDVCDHRKLSQNFINKIFSEKEKNAITDNFINAYLFWAARESFCKNTGEGLSAYILTKDFSFILNNNENFFMFDKFFSVKVFECFTMAVCRDSREDFKINYLTLNDLMREKL